MKKLAGLLLAVLMICTMLPISVLADDTIITITPDNIAEYADTDVLTVPKGTTLVFDVGKTRKYLNVPFEIQGNGVARVERGMYVMLAKNVGITFEVYGTLMFAKDTTNFKTVVYPGGMAVAGYMKGQSLQDLLDIGEIPISTCCTASHPDELIMENIFCATRGDFGYNLFLAERRETSFIQELIPARFKKNIPAVFKEKTLIDEDGYEYTGNLYPNLYNLFGNGYGRFTTADLQEEIKDALNDSNVAEYDGLTECLQSIDEQIRYLVESGKLGVHLEFNDSYMHDDIVMYHIHDFSDGYCRCGKCRYIEEANSDIDSVNRKVLTDGVWLVENTVELQDLIVKENCDATLILSYDSELDIETCISLQENSSLTIKSNATGSAAGKLRTGWISCYGGGRLDIYGGNFSVDHEIKSSQVSLSVMRVYGGSTTVGYSERRGGIGCFHVEFYDGELMVCGNPGVGVFDNNVSVSLGEGAVLYDITNGKPGTVVSVDDKRLIGSSANNPSYEEIAFLGPSRVSSALTASVLSQGNLWIVIIIAVFGIGTVVTLVIVKRKKKTE